MNIEICDPEEGSVNVFRLPYSTSNETWADDQLDAISSSQGAHAVVVGSGNAPNVLPLIRGLEVVTFADRNIGHKEVFRYKMAAANRAVNMAVSLGESFYQSLNMEAEYFDAQRIARESGGMFYGPGGRLHWTASNEHRRRFAELGGRIEVEEAEADFFESSTAHRIADHGRIGWLHLSNLASYEKFRGMLDESLRKRSFKHFMENLRGFDDETWVTWSNPLPCYETDDGDKVYGMKVEGARGADLDWSVLYND